MVKIISEQICQKSLKLSLREFWIKDLKILASQNKITESEPGKYLIKMIKQIIEDYEEEEDEE